MNQTRPDKWLEDLLDTEEPRIEDAGFTARVMDTLPRRRPNGLFRAAVILGVTALVSFLVLFVLPGGQVITDIVMSAARADLHPVSIPLFLIVGLIAWGTIALATAEE